MTIDPGLFADDEVGQQHSESIEPLTRSEINALRQKKKQLSAYYQMVIRDQLATIR